MVKGKVKIKIYKEGKRGWPPIPFIHNDAHDDVSQHMFLLPHWLWRVNHPQKCMHPDFNKLNVVCFRKAK